jgi:hypothetical protein
MDLVSNGLKMLNHHFKTTIMNIEQNLITDFSQLKKDDVVLTNKGADLVVFQLMETPRLSASKHQYSTNGWNSKLPNGQPRNRYIAVRCKVSTTTRSSTNGSYTWKQYEFRMPREDDQVEKMDFNYKNVYRIKTANN